jgi:hypothetical protein
VEIHDVDDGGWFLAAVSNFGRSRNDKTARKVTGLAASRKDHRCRGKDTECAHAFSPLFVTF